MIGDDSFKRSYLLPAPPLHNFTEEEVVLGGGKGVIHHFLTLNKFTLSVCVNVCVCLFVYVPGVRGEENRRRWGWGEVG